MERINIVADSKIPFLKGVLEPYANVSYHKGAEILAETLKGAKALITRTRTKCNADLLEGSGIEIITTATIGTDHIDLDYCQSKGIKVINAPGCNSFSVQQYVGSALAFLAHKYDFSLKDKTIGIIGVGNVGGKVKSLAETLGMSVLLNDPPRAREEGAEGFVDIEDVLAKSDIITFHVPLQKTGIDKTYHLADREFFSKVKPGCTIINSSRGPVVDNNSLKEAISGQLVKGVVLDVWEGEPKIDLELMKMVDIATPHIAGYSADGKANGTTVCVNTLADHFGLDELKGWYPPVMPKPENKTEIEVDIHGKSTEEVLSELLTYTYDIEKDHERLVASPGDFEKLREEYPIRREYPSYTIDGENLSDEVKPSIKKLRFNLL